MDNKEDVMTSEDAVCAVFQQRQYGADCYHDVAADLSKKIS